MQTIRILLIGSQSSGFLGATERMIKRYIQQYLKKYKNVAIKLKLTTDNLDEPLSYLGRRYEKGLEREIATDLLQANFQQTLLESIEAEAFDFVVTTQEYLSNYIIDDLLNLTKKRTTFPVNALRNSDAVADIFLDKLEGGLWIAGTKPHEQNMRSKLCEYGITYPSYDRVNAATSNLYRKLYEQEMAARGVDRLKPENLNSPPNYYARFLSYLLNIAKQANTTNIVLRHDFWYLATNDAILNRSSPAPCGEILLPKEIERKLGYARGLEKLQQLPWFNYKYANNHTVYRFYNLEQIYCQFVARRVVSLARQR